MNSNLKVVLNCIGITILVFFIVNLIVFGVEIYQNGLSENWSFKLKHGTFYLDGNPTGMVLGSSRANSFLAVFFIISIVRAYRRGQFSNR